MLVGAATNVDIPRSLGSAWSCLGACWVPAQRTSVSTGRESIGTWLANRSVVIFECSAGCGAVDSSDELLLLLVMTSQICCANLDAMLVSWKSTGVRNLVVGRRTVEEGLVEACWRGMLGGKVLSLYRWAQDSV